MKAIVSVGGCPNNELLKSYFHYHCSYLCSGVQVAVPVFLCDVQIFHLYARETQKAASTLSVV